MNDTAKAHYLSDKHIDFPIDLPKLKPGMVVSMYMDSGPTGFCGQSMNITCPWQEIHIFNNVDEFNEFGQNHRNGSKNLFAYTVVGDYGTGNMRVVDHT